MAVALVARHRGPVQATGKHPHSKLLRKKPTRALVSLPAMTRLITFVSAALLAVGVGSAGYLVGNGIAERTRGARIISVKGLSEKEVPASVAIWDVGYSAAGNELPAVNDQLAQHTKLVLEYLRTAGFDEKDMAVQPPSVRDV